MNQLKTLVARLVRDEEGQDLIQYALLGALIAVGIAATLTLLSNAINAQFQKVIDLLK